MCEAPRRGSIRPRERRDRCCLISIGGIGFAGAKELLGRRSGVGLGLRAARLLHRIGAILRGHHRLELHLLLGCERQELVGGLPDLKRPFRLLAAGSDGIEGYSVISQGAHDLRLHPHALFMSLHGSIEPRTRIGVDVSNLEVTVEGDKATARFRQDYTSDTLNVTSRKTLDMVKSGNRWLIVRESTGS